MNLKQLYLGTVAALALGSQTVAQEPLPLNPYVGQKSAHVAQVNPLRRELDAVIKELSIPQPSKEEVENQKMQDAIESAVASTNHHINKNSQPFRLKYTPNTSHDPKLGQTTPVSVFTNTSVKSNYVTRGFVLSEEPVLQNATGVTFDHKYSLILFGNVGLANAQGNLLGETGLNEIDVTLEYADKGEGFSYALGAQRFLFPLGQSDGYTSEFYGKISATDVPLKPGLEAYLDIENGKGLHLRATVEQPIDLSSVIGNGVSAKLYGSAGYNVGYFDLTGLADMKAGVAVNWQISPKISVGGFAEVNYMPNVTSDPVQPTFGVSASITF